MTSNNSELGVTTVFSNPMTNQLGSLVASSRPVNTLADYDLMNGAAERAQQAGLVGAQWYQCSVPRASLKELMKRDDHHAVKDTLLWFALVLASGATMVVAWHQQSAWLWPLFFVYATLYCGPADSRWHEASHGTAFKTRWMSSALYQVASFMVLRRPTRWRWSHTRHHTDTLITGLDPEIAAPVPAQIFNMLANCFQLLGGPAEIKQVLLNATGQINATEKTFVPEMEWPKMIKEARVWLLIYSLVIFFAIYFQTILPLLLIGLPSFVGAWLFNFFGLTQHAGLPENVLDHRLNCRTVLMNPIFKFLYWNMNYHLEHHMFPMVPYHALPRLHELIKADCPPAYTSSLQAYREIIPALLKQSKDAAFYIQRPLTPTK